MLWAALWLHRATGKASYLDYAVDMAEEFGGTTWAITEFSWDVKYAGLQILATKVSISCTYDCAANKLTNYPLI